MISSRSPRIDWGNLLMRLTSAAKKLFRQGGCDPNQDLPGTDVSAEVLALDAAIEFFEGEKVKWKPKSIDDDPFPLIMTVMRHNFIDIVRSAGHRRARLLEPLTDEEGASAFEHLATSDSNIGKLLANPSGFTDVEARILADEMAEEFYVYADGDQDLKDVIDAVIYGECRKRREIADLLTISVQEVTDRWKRLRYNYSRATLTSHLEH